MMSINSSKIRQPRAERQQVNTLPARPYLTDELEALQREADRLSTQEAQRQPRE